MTPPEYSKEDLTITPEKLDAIRGFIVGVQRGNKQMSLTIELPDEDHTKWVLEFIAKAVITIGPAGRETVEPRLQVTWLPADIYNQSS